MTEVWEFYAPFAHIEGKYEWCRIRTTTHGTFDTFILFPYSKKVIVYVCDDSGERFMHERYPECDTFRAEQLTIQEDAHHTVEGALLAAVGPVREATMRFVASHDLPRSVEYGGTQQLVWNSTRFACWGVDLIVDAQAAGQIRWDNQQLEALDGVPAVVTLGSMGRIMSLDG